MNNPALVVVGYNKPDSISRLLQLLSKANYDGLIVPLIISIDNSGCDKVKTIAEQFKWARGKKTIISHSEKLGLRNYIISCGKYIKELIYKLNLQKNVIFTGIFTEQEMCERYHKFHVFVSSSIIKNESNSLSDAKLLGVPCVASFVGGVSDRLKHKVNVFLYQADTTYILAHYLCKIFGNNALSLKFSLMAKQNALKTYNKEENLNKLLEIYKNITNGST